LYEITFEDDSKFEGGQPNDSKWNLIPDKPIKSITYKLAGESVYLENYKSYNHLVERPTIIGIGSYISKVILMAENNGEVLCFIFNYNKQMLLLEKRIFGQEYEEDSTSGWKKGILSNIPPKYQIN
jgi:hypothetical protein